MLKLNCKLMQISNLAALLLLIYDFSDSIWFFIHTRTHAQIEDVTSLSPIIFAPTPSGMIWCKIRAKGGIVWIGNMELGAVRGVGLS